MKKKIDKFAEASWFLALIISSLGVCLSAKSGFGVSMVIAPAYILYQKLSIFYPWFTFGVGEYCLQALLVLIMCIIYRKVKLKYFLSFGTAVCYGILLDFWYRILGKETYLLLWQRCLSSITGLLITDFSLALFFHTYLPQEAYELFVKEISEHFHFSITRVKWSYDFCSLIISIILMFLLFGRFATNMIGINTLIMTFVNAPIIGFFGKVLEQHISFTSIYEPFHKKFEKIMN